MVLKGIINFVQSSALSKLSVLAMVGIPTIMTISMHGDVLAVGEPGYQLTISVSSYPFGTSTLGISITTANGYTDHANVGVSDATSWTFNIPSNQGSWVRVCVNSDTSSGENCNTYNTSGTDISVSLSPPPGNSYYIYPDNSYYIYPGNSYGHYNHHDRDHGYGGHDHGGDHGYGGHQDSGNIGYGGHQDSGNNGVGGYGGHQDSGNIGNRGGQDSSRWVGGHQYSGNDGITQPIDHLHHLSNGAPMMDESSDDD